MEIEALYHAHGRALYAFIYTKVGNREAAEDLTSAVFEKALARLDLAREEHSGVAWLYQVARHAVADYWRAGHAERVLAFEDAHTPLPPCAASDVDRQEHTAARARALLTRLPENYRTVLTHRVLDGLSVAETATRMGTTEGNVKVLLHRALKHAAARGEKDTVGRREDSTADER